MKEMCFNKSDPTDCVLVPVEGSGTNAEDFDPENPPMVGNTSGPLPMKEVCAKDDPTECWWVPEKGSGTKAEDMDPENRTNLGGDNASGPIPMKEMCFNENDPTDCVWVPVEGSGTNAEDFEFDPENPMVGDTSGPLPMKEVCAKDDPTECWWVPEEGSGTKAEDMDPENRTMLGDNTKEDSSWDLEKFYDEFFESDGASAFAGLAAIATSAFLSQI